MTVGRGAALLVASRQTAVGQSLLRAPFAGEAIVVDLH